KVESKEGEGSMFSFVNQYHYTNPTEKTEGEPAERLQSFENIRVLLAEDNLVNQFMVKKVLSNWNIEVDAVNDGNSALENFREKHYDLILMDTHMPFLNGYEAIRSIRGEFPLGKKDIPIISLSANVLDEEIQAAYDAGANDVLTKPFEPAALHRKIAALISCTLNK